MRALAGIVIGAVLAGSVSADTSAQQKQCQLQADVMGAVQAVRLERVRKSKAQEAVLERNPDWPESLSTALPAIVEFVYGMKRRDLKAVDLTKDTMTTCMENFAEIKALGETIKN